MEIISPVVVNKRLKAIAKETAYTELLINLQLLNTEYKVYRNIGLITGTLELVTHYRKINLKKVSFRKPEKERKPNSTASM